MDRYRAALIPRPRGAQFTGPLWTQKRYYGAGRGRPGPPSPGLGRLRYARTRTILSPLARGPRFTASGPSPCSRTTARDTTRVPPFRVPLSARSAAPHSGTRVHGAVHDWRTVHGRRSDSCTPRGVSVGAISGVPPGRPDADRPLRERPLRHSSRVARHPCRCLAALGRCSAGPVALQAYLLRSSAGSSASHTAPAAPDAARRALSRGAPTDRRRTIIRDDCHSGAVTA